MKLPKRIPHLLASYSPPVILGVVSVLALVLMLTYQIGERPALFSANEHTARQSSNGLQKIINKPINAPHKLVQYIPQKIGNNGTTAIRLASVTFALLILASFYLLIESWHTRRVAVIATLLFGTSSWFLHIARNGTPEILLAILPGILFSAAWLREQKLSRLSIVLLIFASVGLIYIPGFIWFVLISIGWQIKEIINGFEKLPYKVIVPSTLLTMILLAPLVYASVLDWGVLREIAGLPSSVPTVKEFLDNVLSIPRQLFWDGRQAQELWLPGTPLLDIFSAVMLAIGSYAYIFRMKLDRTRLLIGFGVLSTILIGIGGAVTSTILMPLAYILIAAGIAWLLQQWFTVFPRNPFARSIAVIMVSIAVASSAFYNLNHYYEAWQKAPETRATYSIEP